MFAPRAKICRQRIHRLTTENKSRDLSAIGRPIEFQWLWLEQSGLEFRVGILGRVYPSQKRNPILR